MKRLLILYLILHSFYESFSQTCNGVPPTQVNIGISNWKAKGDIGHPENTKTLLCGFPTNANIVGYIYDNVMLTMDEDNSDYCSDFIIYIDGYEITPAGDQTDENIPCTPASGGQIDIIQSSGATLTASQAGCISLEAILAYVTPPVGMTATTGSLTFFACPENVILPIIIKSFHATASEGKNIIIWETESETNNKTQSVQKSRQDMNDWETIFSTHGTNSNHPKQYQAIDNAPFERTFYKIESVDYDGRIQYSDIISVHNESMHDLDIRISPNPASQYIEINADAQSGGLAFYTIKSLSGGIIKKGKIDTSVSKSKIDVSMLPAGVYSIVFEKENKMTFKKILIYH